MKKITLFVILASLFLLKSNTTYSQTSIPTYTISQVKQIDSTGVADSLNVYCKLYGTINSINYTATGGLQFYILDQDNGIFVYKAAALTGYTFTEGDSVAVIGKIIQNAGTGNSLSNGTIALALDSLDLLSQDNALQSPIIITQLKNDSLESRLVMIDSLTYLSGWTGNNTRTVLAMHGTDTITIRIPTTCNLHNVVAPTHTVYFSITGFDNQNASATPPYIGGYRIYPRDSNDYVVHYANPSVLTEGVTSITQTFAICKGYIPSDGGHLITTRGICYDTISNPDTTYHITVTGTTGLFTGNISGLTGGTTYHYRAYAINSLGLFYGDDSVFTTSPVPVIPIVTTNNPTNITISSAVVVGNVINNGGDTITTQGVCYSTSPIPTLSDSVIYFAGTTTPFSDTIQNLSQVTTYYARAFATSDVGTGYGNIVSFTTPKLPPLYTISQVRTVNVNGVADSLTVNCRLVGTVHSVNYANNATSLAFYICDTSSGIYVYKLGTNLGYTVTRGDMIRVIGKIAQVNGLIEIVADSIVKISSGNTLNTPIVLTTLSDPYESRLIRMNNLVYVSGWPVTAGNTATVKAFDGIDSITIIISRYSIGLQGKPAPTDTFSVIGIESQNDNVSPYTTGYDIYPRDSMDIIITGTAGINENKSKPAFSVYPNPGNGNFKVVFSKTMDADIRVFSLIGSLVEERTINSTYTNLDISSYGKGMYMIQITDRKTGLSTTEKLIVQ